MLNVVVDDDCQCMSGCQSSTVSTKLLFDFLYFDNYITMSVFGAVWDSLVDDEESPVVAPFRGLGHIPFCKLRLRVMFERGVAISGYVQPVGYDILEDSAFGVIEYPLFEEYLECWCCQTVSVTLKLASTSPLLPSMMDLGLCPVPPNGCCMGSVFSACPALRS
ncbi:hypothetical protein QAD02_012696 [Eretmocerus hayati]|uniref:Uncharacterized protein n=1 Tax=Eretmocerus hayati TaxID=131215 RepID=A0ACC2P2Z7_9HYME|nr:hypothetical protein QAD02_012696 [Eretmocerus hayati]